MCGAVKLRPCGGVPCCRHAASGLQSSPGAGSCSSGLHFRPSTAKHLESRPVQRRRHADVRVVPQPRQVQLLGVDGRAVICNRRV